MKGLGRTPWLPCNAPDWYSLQIKRVLKVTLGKMLQNNPSASSDSEVAYLKAQHVQWDRVKETLIKSWHSFHEQGSI